MYWPQALLLGATGGLIVEVIAVWGHLTTWQRDRHRARASSRKRPLPPLTKYIDPPADILVALTRILMGAGAGWLMHDQVTGPIAAIAVGAAAPALLRQLGTTRAVQDALLASAGAQVSPADRLVSRSAPNMPALDQREHRQAEGALE
ncbi:hypothetical protein ACU635_35225 [[Actinomadura] parvosata]|uniref:hypothetical protein n=1 Tax=[Actinomadura] parvosata TaxID=1955412 RepID=UPI00406C531B